MISSQYTSNIPTICTEYPLEFENQHSSCFRLEKLFNNLKFQSKDVNGVKNISAVPDQDNPLQLINPQKHISISHKSLQL